MTIAYSKKSINQLAVDLPEEPNFALGLITERFLDLVNIIGKDEEAHDQYLEGLGILKAYAESKKITLPDAPIISENKAKNIVSIFNYFQLVFTRAQKQRNRFVVEKAKSKYKLVFSGDFYYKFTEGDLKQVQLILNDLRDIITESEEFEKDYKKRLLNKLEKLQQELHKKVSTLDNIWGLIGEAGVVIGKFGKNSKPIVDRIRELVEIVWRVQSMAEELPLGTPYPLLRESEQQED